MRRLLRASVENPHRVDFPAFEGIGRPGWDGIVIADIGNDFVPAGMSLWELGTDDDPRGKAERDFTKRSEEPLGFVAAESTFVFVTPRKWSRKGDWVKEKRELKTWKDVRVYDSDNIEQWLETAPAVNAWLARHLGLRPPGVDDPENHWEGISHLTTPPLRPGVFLACRSKEAEQFSKWLDGPAGALIIETRSPGEGLDFVCACLSQMEGERRDSVLARTVLVETGEAWEDLAVSTGPLILVAKPALSFQAEMVASAVSKGHHVVCAVVDAAEVRGECIMLPRVYRWDLARALREAGFGEIEAERTARAAGGSLTILKRYLARFPSRDCPAWAKPDVAAAAAPFLWVGGWSEKSEADKGVVAGIGARPYEEMEEITGRLRCAEDPLLVRVLGWWSVISPDDAWMLLGRFVTEAQLKRFMAAAVEVLGEDDPRFDRPEVEHARVLKPEDLPKHSPLLRKSVAETLALLATLGPTIGIPVDWNMPVRIERLVEGVLPKNASWKRWASLDAVLPPLAEASPDAFLTAVERDLQEANSQLVRLLGEEGEVLLGECKHAGLLWALETLAWSPMYLSRVCAALVDLDERDPGGRWGNRPGASVTNILCALDPQTAAALDARLKILDYLLATHPKGAWRLLIALLPQVMLESAEPTRRPNWREWAVSKAAEVSPAEYERQWEACAKRAITECRTDVDRWCALMEGIERIPVSGQGDLLTALTALARSGRSQDERRRLSDILRRKVEMNREYADADWSLPKEMTEALDRICRDIDPTDAVLRHAWLFEPWPNRHAIARHESWEKGDEELRARRLGALDEILRDGGLDNVRRLCGIAESPRTVGFLLAAGQGDAYLPHILPSLLGSSDKGDSELAAGFLYGRFLADGWNWVDGIHPENWPLAEAVKLLRVIPFDREAWNRAAQFGADREKAYWETVGVYNPELGPADLGYAVERLLEKRRPGPTLNLLTMALRRKVAVPSEWLLRTLEQVPTLDGNEMKGFLKHIEHDVDDVFGELQTRADVPEERMAKLEWFFLGLLDGYRGSPETLHRWLTLSPTFFIDILRAVFPSDASVAGREITEFDRRRAAQGFRLLLSWDGVPGRREDGRVDGEILRGWVEEARTLAESAGLLESCDKTIGRLLAKAPSEPDVAWPCAAVRSVVEDTRSERMDQGFEYGIYNLRPSTWKSLHEGGMQERAVAEKYETLAAACQMEYPRVAAILGRVAESYRERGKQEDERAQWED
jgi:hypothetical protein